MKKAFRILGLLALSAVSISALAAEDDMVRLVAKDKDGKSVGVVPVTLQSKIRFTSEKVEVYDGETAKESFRYGNIATISFISPGTDGVSSVETQTSLKIAENPVGELLQISGFEGAALPLAVYGLDGGVKVSIAEWNGRPVDVSFLTPGLYFVTVNKTTLKFIKK